MLSKWTTSGMAPMVWALGLTQVVGYGTLYYSFSALAPSMAQDFGWPEEWVYGLLSASLLIGGLVAPVSGQWADKFGAARVMVWGSLAAALALAACALAPERVTFALGLVAIEVASAFVFYATAFAVLAQAAGGHAQRSITHLTLIGGFASTIFWPITAALHDVMSWREVYLTYAALNLAICVPVHFWLARHTAREQDEGAAKAMNLRATLPSRYHLPVMLLMMVGFALLSFVSSAMLVHMVPLLDALGLGASGVIVTTLFGPSQVLSRLINMQLGRGLSQPALAVVAAALGPIALILLVATAPWFPGAALFAVLFGMGNGLFSIVSGSLPLVMFGADGYGRRLGLISSARLIISSIAPFAFSVVVAVTSMQAMLWVAAAVGLCAMTIFSIIWWMAHPLRSTANVPAS